jgi:hypothetical protein
MLSRQNINLESGWPRRSSVARVRANRAAPRDLLADRRQAEGANR